MMLHFLGMTMSFRSANSPSPLFGSKYSLCSRMNRIILLHAGRRAHQHRKTRARLLASLLRASQATWAHKISKHFKQNRTQKVLQLTFWVEPIVTESSIKDPSPKISSQRVVTLHSDRIALSNPTISHFSWAPSHELQDDSNR